MPSRNQIIIRRDINCLKDTIERTRDINPALSAILSAVSLICGNVNQVMAGFSKNNSSGR